MLKIGMYEWIFTGFNTSWGGKQVSWGIPPKDYRQFIGIPDYPNPFNDILKLKARK